MREEVFFEIPANNEFAMTELVRAIPSNWSLLDGMLEAPTGLFAADLAVRDTILVFSRSYMNSAVLRGRRQDGKLTVPDVYEVLVEGKLTGAVCFEDAGSSRDLSLKLAKKIVVRYIERGYRGWLIFFGALRGKEKCDSPQRCAIRLAPWKSFPGDGKETGPQPARIKLSWDVQSGEPGEDINSILALCRELRLQEYHPATVR